MARIEPTPPRAARNDPLLPLEPLGRAVSVVTQPGALMLGLLAGGVVGALAGLMGGLAFVGSPAAPVVLPLAAAAIVAIWSVATGAVALVCTNQAVGDDSSILRAIREAVRRIPALLLVALPISALLVALVVVQVGVFVLTRSPDNVIASDQTIVVIAALYTLLFLIDTLALALTSVALWVVVPYVVVDGRGPVEAYVRARDAFWRRPGWSVGVMAGVLAIASAVSTALMGIVAVALVLATGTEVLGSNTVILGLFAAPPMRRSFVSVTAEQLTAVVIMATGIGAAIGGAVGIGHSFGVAGGVGLRRAMVGGSDEDPN